MSQKTHPTWRVPEIWVPKKSSNGIGFRIKGQAIGVALYFQVTRGPRHGNAPRRFVSGEAQPGGDVHHQRQRHGDQAQPHSGGDLPTGREAAALGIGPRFCGELLVIWGWVKTYCYLKQCNFQLFFFDGINVH